MLHIARVLSGAVEGNSRAVFLMVIGTVFFSSMHALIRYMSADLHAFELAFFRNLFGLVIIARAKHPDPFRTRPLSAAAPMVLRLKTWESRSPPDLERDDRFSDMKGSAGQDPRAQPRGPSSPPEKAQTGAG